MKPCSLGPIHAFSRRPVADGRGIWRNPLAREDLIEVEGVITDVHPGGLFTVKLDQGPAIQARVGGKMRQHFIRIVLGDRVKVGVSPYDPTHGIITYRTK
ncbi:Translation initiation factor 1 [Vulgatibacter incomptus]|uniref:Translation initiation factor IF-1 n=1 Tax=Vulgatibacter incomptus TaxID=1391653 RepID=A0A0K1PFI1_9BACT|nr:Translation initiation factor 1 [Vulgatibacter incomptus]